ncbi:calmin isoform X4 [Lynx canadensis]|uniref:calmin isoform X4 n=1 Tax=Lynx canadensis TaxID=61383 RepID=UPI0011B01C66|nr:calmin isoform X4 [Lynx canadensis]
MAAHEWDWFQREELIGQISDIRVQNLQVERENVQKRTFTRWVNLHLEKCDPPLEVKDLFIDIQDGKILMALLEVLSGRNLLHEYKSSSHRIFRLNNIAKALKFLEDSNVKLVSIDAAEIADGNPSLVLGLIWNIILFFQEDLVDSDKEAPIESTFVHIKETPSEQESTVFLLTENGERAYTVNHEASHPPPSKVFVCDKSEGAKECYLSVMPSQALSDSSTDFMHQIIDQALQEVPGKASSTGEPSPESSILSSRKDNRRCNSLPIKKTVHFEADTYKEASCSKDPFYSQDLRFEGSPRGTKDSLKQDGDVLAAETAEEKPKQEAPKIPEAASDESPGVESLVDRKINHSQTSESCPSWNGAPEGAAGGGKESRPLSPLGDNAVMADSLEIKVQLLTVEAMAEEDYFESTPLKASKFNSDLIDFASTSQAFNEVPPPREKRPVEEEVPEDHAEKLGKRRSKSAHQRKDSDESPERLDKQEPHKDPGREDPGFSLAPEEAPVEKKPEAYEKPKRKSARRRRGEDEGEAAGPQGPDGELPSDLPSGSLSLETLHSRSQEGLDFKPSPPLSKVSVIPHDLFYYPHYEVPLAAVLEAYAEGSEDPKHRDLDLEEPEDYLHDPGAGAEAEEAEEAEVSWNSCSFSGPDEEGPEASIPAPSTDRGAEGTRPASEPAPPAPPEGHRPGEAEESGPVESHQSQESENSGNLANSLEEKVTGESISSKKKEKRKHVDHVESSIFIAPGTVRSSEDLEGDTGDHKVLSRTSHSDSSIYIRRHTNRSLESDHFSYVQLRNAADQDDRRNRMLTRYNTQKLTELILQFYGIRADMKKECKHTRMSMKEGQRLWRSRVPGEPELTERLSDPVCPAAGYDVFYSLPLAPGLLPTAVPTAGRHQTLMRVSA